MKITVNVDLTPEEARQFLGLPNVERIQDQFIKNAEQYLGEASANQYGDLVKAALQPMFAYQQWLAGMMSGDGGQQSRKDDSKDNG